MSERFSSLDLSLNTNAQPDPHVPDADICTCMSLATSQMSTATNAVHKHNNLNPESAEFYQRQTSVQSVGKDIGISSEELVRDR